MCKRALYTLLLLCIALKCFPENWMSRLGDTTPVWKVSIPGTHDSATGHGFTGFLGTMVGSSMAQTQDKNITGQWDSGIRCFDLRPAVNGSKLSVFHGILQTKLDMKDALQQLCGLLDANPSEFCVVVMRHETEADDNNGSWGGLMRDILATEQIKSHLVAFRGTLTVKQARGKIILISRDTYENGPSGAYAMNWTHEADINKQMTAKLVNASGAETKLYVQDFYESTDGRLDTKKETVIGLLKKMLEMRKKTTAVWCINYCSAYSKTTNIFGNKISSSDGYRENASVVHSAVLDYMATQELGGPMGIVIMDFAGTDKSGSYNVRSKELTDCIIHSNFAETELKEQTIDRLKVLIEEANAIDPTVLSTLIATQLATAVEKGKTIIAKSSPTLTDLTKAADTLENVLNIAKSMNISKLKSIYNEMKDWGYDDAMAQDAIENAPTQEDADNAYSGIVTRYKWSQASKSEMPTMWSSPSQSVIGIDDNTPATYVDKRADGYYLYNVGTGRWFCGGDDWGAHAAVGFPGIKITTPKDNWEEGHYNGIVTWLCNGDWTERMKLNNEGYCDTNGNAWKFWIKDAAKGIYTISNNGDQQGNNTSNGLGTKDLMGFSGTSLDRVDVHQTDDNDPCNQWIFVTEAQRDQMAMEAWDEASPEQPIDLTYKVQMPGFNQRERTEGSNQQGETLPWTCNHANYTYDNAIFDYGDANAHRHIICERGKNHSDFCCDIYDWEEFSLSQTISGLRPGVYRVRVQGYYNMPERLARLEANERSQSLMYQRDVALPSWINDGNYGDNTWHAIECFQNGLYWNEVLTRVRKDGTLTISIKKDSRIEGDCFLFDNFRLEYVGNDALPNAEEIRSQASALTSRMDSLSNIVKNVCPEALTDEAFARQYKSTMDEVERLHALIESLNDIQIEDNYEVYEAELAAANQRIEELLQSLDTLLTAMTGVKAKEMRHPVYQINGQRIPMEYKGVQVTKGKKVLVR